ncbi:hypothetical protein GCM10007420_19420 [Glycocaulis albus]|uniref:Uncharacterized protein n=1 Tax=Glycocaulis albus TaxID=1382801 RepID=A0ABQ1XU21_9PROT|nr:hypothetical protein GCM10007420_19420 [Glycocaulis albus]
MRKGVSDSPFCEHKASALASFISVLVCVCPISLTDTAIAAKARAFLHMGAVRGLASGRYVII